MENSSFMTIFEPRIDFLVTLIFLGVLIGKIVFIDQKKITDFKSTLIMGLILIIPVFSYLFPHLITEKLQFTIQYTLFGIVFGLIFNILFIKIELLSKLSVEHLNNINKRKVSVQKKIPILFGIAGFSLENNAETPYLSVMCLVIALCASILFASIKNELRSRLFILCGFTLTILFQFLLSYNEINLSAMIRTVIIILWILSITLIYMFDKLNGEIKID
jgi:hypothetical protein